MTDIAELGFSVDTRGLAKGERALDSLDKAGGRVTKSALALDKVFKVAGAGAVLLGSAVAKGVSSYKAYGTALGEVNTLLDSSWSTDSINEMNKGVKALTIQLGGDVTSKTKALYQVISAGASSSSEALDTLTVSNKLAIAGVTDIETAVTSIAGPLKVYKDSNLTAAAASESLLVAVKNGITTIPELSSAIGRVSPIAKNAGLEFDELAGSISTITSAGINTNEAVTGLKAALSGMVAPAKEARDLARALGIEMSAADIKAKGFVNVLADMRDKTGGNIETLKKLLGSTEAVGAVLALTDRNGAQLNKTMADMATKTGALDSAVNKMQSGTAALGAEWDKFKGLLNVAFITIGEKVAPVLVSLLQNIGTLTSALGTAAIAVTTFAATFGALKILPALFASLTAQVVATSSAVSFMGIKWAAASTGMTLATTAAAGLKTALALMGGPLGVIALVVAGLVTFALKARDAKNANMDFIKSINLADSASLSSNLDKLNTNLSDLHERYDAAAKESRKFQEGMNHSIVAVDYGAIKMASLKKEIIKTADSYAEVSRQIDKNKEATEKLAEENEKLTGGVVTLGSGLEETSEHIRKQKELMDALTKASKDMADAIPLKASEKFAEVLTDVRNATGDVVRSQIEFEKALKDGTFKSIEEASRVANALGLDLEKLGLKTEETASFMSDQWATFKERSFDSLQSFYRSGLDNTKSFSDSIKDLFKDMVANILAQITALVAANAFKKLLGVLSGDKYGNSSTGLFDGVGGLFANSDGSSNSSASNAAQAVFGGNSGNNVNTAGNALGAASDLYSGYNQIDAGLEEGGTNGAISVISGASTLYGGATKAVGLITKALGPASTSTGGGLGAGFGTTVTGGGSSVVAPTVASNPAVTTTAASGASSALAATAGWIAVGIIADQALNDGRVSRGFGVEAEGRYQGWKDLFDGDYSSFIKSQWQAPLDSLKETFGGRSTDELASDQLNAVIDSLSAGRSESVGLNHETAFFGGFNEETTFFQTLSEDLDFAKVSELLKERLGFDDVRQVGESNILRLEKAGSNFGLEQDKITTNVLAAIAEVKFALTDSQKFTIKSMGESLNQMDILFDATADSALSVKDRTIEAYSQAFNTSLETANQWYTSNEELATKLGGVFTDLSGTSLETFTSFFDSTALAGDQMGNELGSAFREVSNVIEMSTSDAALRVRDNFDLMGDSANKNFELIDFGLASLTKRAQEEAKLFAQAYTSQNIVVPINGQYVGGDGQGSAEVQALIQSNNEKTRAELETQRSIRNAG